MSSFRGPSFTSDERRSASCICAPALSEARPVLLELGARDVFVLVKRLSARPVIPGELVLRPSIGDGGLRLLDILPARPGQHLVQLRLGLRQIGPLRRDVALQRLALHGDRRPELRELRIGRGDGRLIAIFAWTSWS